MSSIVVVETLQKTGSALVYQQSIKDKIHFVIALRLRRIASTSRNRHLVTQKPISAVARELNNTVVPEVKTIASASVTKQTIAHSGSFMSWAASMENTITETIPKTNLTSPPETNVPKVTAPTIETNP